MQTQHFEKQYCFECCAVHWVEIPFHNRVICHGYDYIPRNTPAQYIKRSGKGFDVIQVLQPAPLPLEWEILASTPEPIDIEVDF